jgi:hypothetical protein
LDKVKKYHRNKRTRKPSDQESQGKFIEEIEETARHGKFVKVKDFAEEYGLK